MVNEVEPISYINVNNIDYPIDAISIGEKSVSELQTMDGLVTSIDSSSDDEHYPSAKCLYDLIYGSAVPEHDYSKDYLTFEPIEDSTFKFTRNSLEYSIDDGNTWVNLPVNTDTPTISSGNKIMFKATNPSITSNYGIGTFSSTGNFNVSGNIMSLLYGDDFDSQTSLNNLPYTFVELFYSCSKVIDVSDLILPATTLANYCYFYMFFACTNLISTPELPATTLVTSCYSNMFYNCTSLTTPPVLPATTLADNCYNSMFRGCYNLTSAPTLPATRMQGYCYQNMFYGCSHITSAPALPATTLADNCYNGMFEGCYNLTSAPALPATTLAVSCYNSMFYDCYRLTSAPVLPATTLVTSCYNSMFYNCSMLNSITCYATTNIISENLNNWVYGVSSSGIFTGDPSSNWIIGHNGIPYNWNKNVNVIDITSNDSIAIYVDDFLYTPPLDMYIDDPVGNGCNAYEYIGNTINYEGETYYIWIRIDDRYHDVTYALTTTIDYTTLRQKSLEYDKKNIVQHPVSYFFDDQMNEYSTCQNQVIVSISNYDNHLIMYVDDFVKPNIGDIEDFIDDPEAMGCNYYEYCEPFEYDGDTYYIWKRDDNQSCVYYLLTSTIDFNTLQSYSLEEDIANLGICPIEAYLQEDLTVNYTKNDRYDNIVKVIKLSDYNSAGTLGMYIDDFMKADVDGFVDDPVGKGCNAYEYTGEDISYDGDDYYLWKNMGNMVSNYKSNKYYALTSTVNQQTLNAKSIAYSTNNILESPIEVFLDYDGREYKSGHSYNIVSVGYTTGLEMWIDEEFDLGWEDGGYSDMEEYLDWYLNNIDSGGGKHYYYIDEFEYDGDNNYIWYCYIDDTYLITDTNNVNTLTSYSIESDYSNVDTHPLIAFLDKDLNVYGPNRIVSDYSIVKVTSSQPKQMMFVDDFLETDIDADTIQDFIDDPETMGCNYYEYCDSFEYNGDTYYIWKYYGNDEYIYGAARYVLTDTNNLQTLQSYSLESNLNNITARPIIAYFDEDLLETYTSAPRRDSIVTVFEL